MKTSKWILCLGGTLILLLPLMVMAQSGGAAPNPGLLEKIGSWLQNNFLIAGGGLLLGLVPSLWKLGVKKFAHSAAPVCKEVSEFFSDLATLSSAVDNAIKEDGKIEQNSIAEVIAAGKEVIAEGKDVIISIKPKK